ncbi:uncharacterized protein [Chironomus tepperi]
MFTLTDNSNKHKVAFYVALVILLITLGQCQSQFIDATEVISHSSPKNTSTDVSVIRGYGANRSVSEKLTEIRQLLRSLIFDWNLGESGIENGISRTFGRIRMMKNIFLPVAFIGGFLTAVIFSIKAIGVINFFLISSLVVLNMAVIVGKLIYAKKIGYGASQTHYHSHYNQQLPPIPSYQPHPTYGSYGPSYGPSYGSNIGGLSPPWHADNRVDDKLRFGRYLEHKPSIEPVYEDNIPFSSNQIPTFQAPLNSLQQPQLNTIPQNNPFGRIQTQSPQQVQQQQPTSSSFNQPLNQLYSQLHDMRYLNNDIPAFETATTPSSGIKMINPQEIKPQSTYSPLEMEKILTNALAQISESKRTAPATSLPNVLRFKRKSSNHQPYLNLLRPFS